MFGGIGGFRLGLEKASERFKNVWYCDNDKWCAQVYNYRFGERWKPSDIRSIDARDIPEHDILCAGFPCQSFSTAGKKLGFHDTRGTLFFEILRIAEAGEPRLLFLENVKGILSNNKGKTFATVLASLDELGYDAEWQVFNSKDFVVPQIRERIYIVGHLRKGHTRQVFPIQKVHEQFDTQEKGPRQLAYTLTTGHGGLNFLWDPVKRMYRYFTPVECERLQGFPDDWTKYGRDPSGGVVEISDTQRYKMLGNAVTVSVIKALGAKILKAWPG